MQKQARRNKDILIEKTIKVVFLLIVNISIIYLLLKITSPL